VLVDVQWSSCSRFRCRGRKSLVRSD